jgi:phospholipid/cholesterol/gamma-HCH transport system permease protein
MARVGWDSLPIISLMAIFTGMTIGLYSGLALKDVGGEEFQANVVSRAIVQQLGPLLTGLLLAGRIGAAFTAEIGTMSVNQEIDAMKVLGISPIRYLAVPRFVACAVMLPVLVAYANVIGILGGAIVGKRYFAISYEAYIRLMSNSLHFHHVAEGQLKALLYGAIIAIIAFQRGSTARGGAEGVGDSTTSSVVASFVWIFIANYFVTFLMR